MKRVYFIPELECNHAIPQINPYKSDIKCFPFYQVQQRAQIPYFTMLMFVVS